MTCVSKAVQTLRSYTGAAITSPEKLRVVLLLLGSTPTKEYSSRTPVA